jgi:hypothetical protein
MNEETRWVHDINAFIFFFFSLLIIGGTPVVDVVIAKTSTDLESGEVAVGGCEHKRCEAIVVSRLDVPGVHTCVRGRAPDVGQYYTVISYANIWPMTAYARIMTTL